MKQRASLTGALLCILSACAPDESLARYAGFGSEWQLQNDALLLRFDNNGRISGQTACGPISGTQTAPYPWLSIRLDDPHSNCAGVTGQLEAMTLSEVSGNVLVLSNDDGAQMVFDRQP